jgi:hypothetical protein
LWRNHSSRLARMQQNNLQNTYLLKLRHRLRLKILGLIKIGLCFLIAAKKAQGLASINVLSAEYQTARSDNSYLLPALS